MSFVPPPKFGKSCSLFNCNIWVVELLAAVKPQLISVTIQSRLRLQMSATHGGLTRRGTAGAQARPLV